MSLTESTGIDARILTNLRRELADLERQAAETLADALRNAPALPPEVLAAIETSGVRVNSYGPEGTAVELVARCEVPMASPPPPQWPKDAYYPTRSVTDAWPPLGTYPREALVSPWLAVARREAPAMAETLAGELELLVRLLVPEKLRSAIIARDVLTDGWDWPVIEYPGEARRGAGWWALWGLRELAANLEVVQPRRQRAPGDVCILGRDRSPMIAPDEVAYADAVKWAQPQLSRLFGDQATRLLEARRTLIANRSDGGSPVWIAPYHLGLLFQAVREVEADRRKPAIAVDSGRLHHSLLAEMRDVPKDIRRSIDFDHVGHRVELLAPGKCVQLTLELGDTPSERLAKVLREWRGWKGLRNWIALQRLFSVEGGREGFVRWTVDAHLEALGYSPRERSRLKLRDTVAGEVETFTKIELSVRDKQGRERERRPLVLVGSKYDKLVGSRWHLDGMEFQINPLLYRGVRAENGRLGSNWHPAPIDLAKVDHTRNPYTLALGFLLPIRWRLAQNDDRDHVVLSGESVLRLAGITFQRRKAGEAWKALERDLQKLRSIGGIGRWAWIEDPNTLGGLVRLYPASWMADRTVRKIQPDWQTPSPATGAELREWRKARGWTQEQAAARLRVARRTLTRAEAQPADPVGTALRDALHNVT